MKIHFWGVRGSLPAPLTPVQVQSKISAAVQRITAADIKDSESRERFLANLPEWIFGTAGGNSPCVEVISSENKHVILDAGTGLRLLAKNSSLPPDMHYDMLFSHIHWDHIQGFPYFDFAYNPRVSLDIDSPFENLSEKLSEQMKSPYYPVTIESMT
ncbi:MAG: MBL fold metallo-hydrolase, partial [Treponema sp.]|nr:MBL fold metallo-hydrolase [Treponema sp.]